MRRYLQILFQPFLLNLGHKDYIFLWYVMVRHPVILIGVQCIGQHEKYVWLLGNFYVLVQESNLESACIIYLLTLFIT